MKPRVINFLGGPGVGKSNLATALFSELKFRGINAEYIPEYAKWLAWEGRTGKIHAAQDYIFGKQSFSLMRVGSEVDFMITDACLLNTLVYTPDYFPMPRLKTLAREAYDMYDNINIFILRDKPYNPKGRTQTKEEAIQLDHKIADMLHEQKVEVHVMNWGREVVEKAIHIMQARKWL